MTDIWKDLDLDRWTWELPKDTPGPYVAEHIPKPLITDWVKKWKPIINDALEKAAIFDAWEEERCGYFLPGYGCDSPVGIGNSVMCRKLPNCEVLTDEILWQQIKTARNKLYEDLPTGDVDAFALIKVMQTHIAKLDEILEDK